MIRSMTAFARQGAEGNWGALVWELRSVNHRYLEVSARLPEEFRALEAGLRETAARYLNRGKLDCTLRFQSSPTAAADFSVNRQLAERVASACQEIEGMLSRSAPIEALAVLNWPGVVQRSDPDLGPVQREALVLLERALQELLETRVREGERLRELLEQRCTAITALVQQVRLRLPQILERLRDRLRARIAELGTGADEGRLEQEIALLGQRMDVAEELDRIEHHVGEVLRVLSQEEPAGRRLDFLMQELNREANTLGSKSADPETSRACVELKVLIEQMREQVQNIE